MISSVLIDPYFIAASILYMLALSGLAFVSSSWWSALLLGSGVMLICGIVLVVTGRRVPPPVVIIRPRAELWSMLTWFGLVLLVAAITLAIGLELVSQFTNWFFLVLAPLGLLILVRGRGGPLRSTLRSVGFRRTQLKDGVILAVVMMPLTIPLLCVVGDQQRAAIQMVFHAPFRAALSFLACFIFALLSAGFVEEFFFSRDITDTPGSQSRFRTAGIIDCITSIRFGASTDVFLLTFRANPGESLLVGDGYPHRAEHHGRVVRDAMDQDAKPGCARTAPRFH